MGSLARNQQEPWISIQINRPVGQGVQISLLILQYLSRLLLELSQSLVKVSKQV